MKNKMKAGLISLLCISVLAACGKSNNDTNATPSASNSATSTASAKPAKSVTLSHMTWRVPDVGEGYDLFKKKYESEHPNVKIDINNVASDQYFNMLQTKLLSGDPPDIFTTAMGATELIAQVKNDFVVDLTDEPFVKNILPGALDGAKINGRVYGIPYDLVSLVVLYNKKIFADNGLSVPTNYDEFLQVCEALKAKNITPISYGIKDSYLTLFLPFQIAPTSVYAKDQQFDNGLLTGQTKFNSEGWKRALSIPFELKEKGYFTDNALGVGDQQSVEMFARGEAAMTINGTFGVSVARAANPNLDLGMFPFPGNKPGEENWMALNVGQIMALSSSSKNLEEGKKYLAAWTDKAYAQTWTDQAKSISTIDGVKNDFDPVQNDMTSYLAKMKTWQFANAGWPPGVSDAFMKTFQDVYAGKGTVEDILIAMDKAVEQAKALKK
ncbi:ABC transporter substrate-binding protein [Cohnella soli]|uniref:ABC transporter substrate-binding protein n=1 Tax=Cohnella soli TaxID=425005 RepID=A0ABW0HYD7_9BACL